MPNCLKGTISCAANHLLPGWESPDEWAEYSSWGGAVSLKEERIAIYCEVLDPVTWTKICLEASQDIEQSIKNKDDFLSGRRILWSVLAGILKLPLSKALMKRWTKIGKSKTIEPTAEEVFIYSLFTLNVWNIEGAIRKQIQENRRNTSTTTFSHKSTRLFFEEKSCRPLHQCG